MSNRLRVLEKLQRNASYGVSAHDFPKGFRLAARIHELRCRGYAIDTDLRFKPAVYRYVQGPSRRTE